MDYGQFYQEHIYGYWREGETVTYRFAKESAAESRIENKIENKTEIKIEIIVEKGGKKVSFTIQAYVPDMENRPHRKCPFFICMHPIQPKDYALLNGYAVFFMNTALIASDDNKHNGIFYELYPYGDKKEEQTGVLMAWAWGAAKVLDAVKSGLGEELSLDTDASIVTGVSRYGKATAVCGAFDSRFKMTVPACSGAGGLALYSVTSRGKTYNLEGVGGPAEYTYGENEPLSCLQSEGERGWFNDAFLDYKNPSDISPDQDALVKMAADENRLYFIIAACTGEDWVNAPSMWECYRRANEFYRENGLDKNLVVHFHKIGHAVTEEDMKLMIAYFEHMVYKKPLEDDFGIYKTSVFDGQEK